MFLLENLALTHAGHASQLAEMGERLTEIEMRIAFQEDWMSQLDQRVRELGEQLERLERASARSGGDDEPASDPYS